MLKKAYSKRGGTCRVTFTIPANSNTKKVSLCGEFNEWNPIVHPMKRRKDGKFITTVSLKSGRAYRFKYLFDGQDWENDWSADSYEPNCFGTEDSLIKA